MFLIFDSLLQNSDFKALKCLANVLKTKDMTKYITPARIVKMQLDQLIVSSKEKESKVGMEIAQQIYRNNEAIKIYEISKDAVTLEFILRKDHFDAWEAI